MPSEYLRMRFLNLSIKSLTDSRLLFSAMRVGIVTLGIVLVEASEKPSLKIAPQFDRA